MQFISVGFPDSDRATVTVRFRRDVIDSVTVHGEQDVVHLPDDTPADAIDFRSPSDELLDTAMIGRNSKITFSLYENTNTPYSPSDYTLVAVETSGNGESQTLDTKSLSLTSSFSVTNVRPIKDKGSRPPPFDGKVQITFTNTGTLPVRIEYIGFTSGGPSPNPSPRQRSIAGPSPPKPNYVPTSDTGYILAVGSAPTFESNRSPLWTAGETAKEGAVGVLPHDASWQQVKSTHCTGERHPATLVVVPWHGATHRRSVTFTYAGNTTRKRSIGTEYGCTNVSVVNSQPMNTSTTPAR